VGYRPYIQAIRSLIANQQVFASGMKQEIERCREALELAKKGEVVSLISNGDPGIYGMAGLALELNRQYNLQVEVVPGVTAASAAASLVGAPLMHDFVIISLSTLLTSWELIKKRIRCAADGDFIMAIYNPKSRKRVEEIVEAKMIIQQYRADETPVAIVTNAYRKEQSIVITDLTSFTDEEIGMRSIVIIGNSQTVVHGDKLITPRGYETKYADSF